MTTNFQILPKEQDWWQIDCTPLVQGEGPATTISSFSVTSEGNVVIGSSGPHAPQLNGFLLSIWADSTSSVVGDLTTVSISIVTSTGETLPANPILFETVLRRAPGGAGPSTPTPVVNPPTVTGSRASGDALESLLTALDGLGLIIDNTSS
jgi:hypothetical protein